jgi:hypothetical protein
MKLMEDQNRIQKEKDKMSYSRSGTLNLTQDAGILVHQQKSEKRNQMLNSVSQLSNLMVAHNESQQKKQSIQK